MWVTDAGWTDALRGDHTPLARVSVLYDGQVTTSTSSAESMPEVVDGDVTMSLSSGESPQIATEVSLRLADPTGELWTGRPGSPVGWWGHRLQVQAGVRAGAWESWLPVGTLRVESVAPVESEPWRLMRNGRWVRGGQTIQIVAADMLSQVADEKLTTPTSPPAGATVRSEVGRLLAGIVPVGRWTSTRAVPRSLTYDEHDRLGIVLSLCRVAGLVPWIDRAGVLQAIPATGSGARWRVPMDALIECLPGGGRDGIRNGWVVTSETDSQQPLRGQALEDAGVLRWGGPFGRVPAFAHSPILTTNAACLGAASTNRGTDIASRRQDLTVTCLSDPALDVLDTALIELPDRTIETLVTSIKRPLLGGSMTVTVSAPLEVMG